MGDCISRAALLAAYDAAHVGPPGGARKLIEEAPAVAVPEWISVEERLPKEFVSVLVYMPEERPLPTVHEGFLAREGVWYANHFDRDPMEITHWMPLPEPPEVDT